MKEYGLIVYKILKTRTKNTEDTTSFYVSEAFVDGVEKSHSEQPVSGLCESPCRQVVVQRNVKLSNFTPHIS